MERGISLIRFSKFSHPRHYNCSQKTFTRHSPIWQIILALANTAGQKKKKKKKLKRENIQVRKSSAVGVSVKFVMRGISLKKWNKNKLRLNNQRQPSTFLFYFYFFLNMSQQMTRKGGDAEHTKAGEYK